MDEPDDQDAAIRAASEAIEAMPHREWPTMTVDTSAWGLSPTKTIEISYERANVGPTPVPQDLPAGWTTVEQLKAQVASQLAEAYEVEA